MVIFEVLGSTSVIFRYLRVFWSFSRILDVFLLYIFIDYCVFGWIGFYLLGWAGLDYNSIHI